MEYKQLWTLKYSNLIEIVPYFIQLLFHFFSVIRHGKIVRSELPQFDPGITSKELPVHSSIRTNPFCSKIFEPSSRKKDFITIFFTQAAVLKIHY